MRLPVRVEFLDVSILVVAPGVHVKYDGDEILVGRQLRVLKTWTLKTQKDGSQNA